MNRNNRDLLYLLSYFYNNIQHLSKRSLPLQGLLSIGLGLLFSLVPLFSTDAAQKVERQAIKAPISGDIRQSTPQTSFSVPDIIEKAEHLIQKDANRSDHYSVDDPNYRVEFSPYGVTYFQKQDLKTSDSNSLRIKMNGIKNSLGTPRIPFEPFSVKAFENQVIYQRASDIQEIYDVRRDGVEQSWVIQKSLTDPTGDLILDGSIQTNLTALVSPDGGINFNDAQGRYVTSYGQVTVKDHLGNHLSISPILSDSRLTITIPAQWLAQAVYPIVVDPLIGANIRVDTLTTQDNHPSIAFDGTNYLIAWHTGTANATGTGSMTIRGVRVSTAGTIVDATPLTIGNTATRDDEYPSIVYDSVNTRYIVVWMAWVSATSADIYRNTVTTAGVVGTSTAIVTGGATRILSYPSVACCDVNNNYFVIYGRSGNNTANVASFVTAKYNRGTHTASATADTGTIGTVSSTTGTTIPNPAATVGRPQGAPYIYSLSTTKYLLVWDTYGVDTNGDVWGNVMTVAATPSYTWGTAIAVSNATTGTLVERYPRAAYDGTNALIVFQKGTATDADIYGRMGNPAGVSLTVPAAAFSISVVAASNQSAPSVAYTAGTCSANPMNQYMIVWQDYRNNATNPDIYASPVTTASAVGSAVAVATATTYIKQYPVIAPYSGGCAFMTAWSDTRNTATASNDIYAQSIGFPNISNLSPTSGAVNATISINGLNFGTDPGVGNYNTATNNVKINGVAIASGNVASWSNTAITFRIPNMANGTFPVTVTAGSWTSNSLNLTVSTAALQAVTLPLNNGWQWLSYANGPLSATGGSGSYSWSISVGTLPTGLTLTASTGQISGTPTGFGVSNFTAMVTDTITSLTATQALSITVVGLSTIAVTPANPTLTTGQTTQFTATGTYTDTSSSNLTSVVAWSSSNTAIATINATGLATAGTGLGAVTISAIK